MEAFFFPAHEQAREGQVARHQANRVMASERLAETITCHAWNKAKDRVAFCPNNNELHIYKYEGGKFTKEHVLVEHDQAAAIGIACCTCNAVS